MIQGMETWTWLDEFCLRIYSKITTTMWHWEYLAEEDKRKRLIEQWEEFWYGSVETNRQERTEESE